MLWGHREGGQKALLSLVGSRRNKQKKRSPVGSNLERNEGPRGSGGKITIFV